MTSNCCDFIDNPLFFVLAKDVLWAELRPAAAGARCSVLVQNQHLLPPGASGLSGNRVERDLCTCACTSRTLRLTLWQFRPLREAWSPRLLRLFWSFQRVFSLTLLIELFCHI